MLEQLLEDFFGGEEAIWVEDASLPFEGKANRLPSETDIYNEIMAADLTRRSFPWKVMSAVPGSKLKMADGGLQEPFMIFMAAGPV